MNNQCKKKKKRAESRVERRVKQKSPEKSNIREKSTWDLKWAVVSPRIQHAFTLKSKQDSYKNSGTAIIK